ncbi:hypothetical protein HK096_004987 [Nowakowskiella sp. JEL0078]|nr:hypothetical protein HK096_004987 [Nowakowskiella sp. JEL0078]
MMSSLVAPVPRFASPAPRQDNFDLTSMLDSFRVSTPNIQSNNSSPSPLAPLRATKIVGTLGPASVPIIRELIIAGMNCFRLNFSHINDPELQTPIIREIRKQSQELNIPVSILGDLCGPKIRCNDFGELPYIELVRGSKVTLRHSSKSVPGSNEVECEVVIGGKLKPRKGINVPDLKLDILALTDKDAGDARYMFAQRLDYVALSFVQRAQDVQDLINVFKECQNSETDEEEAENGEIEVGWRPRIISKIEKPQALEEIDQIIEISDGIMVARGDLGVEVSFEKVPVIQKMLIRKANLAEKPVITATQMLESMISSPVPTRAEVSDVANAVFDGTDAVMLSAECAVGKYPIETVKMMGSICLNAEEGSIYAANSPLEFDPQHHLKGISALARPIADASVAAAAEANATAIITFTTSGAMATYVSKRRPRRRIIAVTPTLSIYQRLPLLYGVYPVLSSFMKLNHKKVAIAKLDNTHISSETLERTISPDSLAHAQHAVSHPRNTDSIYAQTERDILALNDSIKFTNDKSTELIRSGDIVVFVSGNYPLPGLNHTMKMTHFGDAIRSERRRHLWDSAIDWASHQHIHHTKEK